MTIWCLSRLLNARDPIIFWLYPIRYVWIPCFFQALPFIYHLHNRYMNIKNTVHQWVLSTMCMHASNYLHDRLSEKFHDTALLKMNPGWVSCTWVQGSKDICKGQKKYAIEFTIYFLGNFSRRQKLIPIRLTSWWAFIIFMGTVICLHLSWPMMGFIQNLWINVCIVHLHAI